ncbi:MAG: dienelactone hydrolase family protein [Syntrophales bacterium]
MKNTFKKLIAFFSICLLFSSFAHATEHVIVNDLGIEKNMKADFILPDGNGPFPAVIILHTSGGIFGAESSYGEELAKKGYASLIPRYFEAHGISYGSRGYALTDHAEEILADLLDALEYLKKNPKIDKDELGAVGFSMGGYWAMVLAAQGKVQAGVSYYGVLSGVGKNRSKMRYKFEDIFDEKSSPVLILHGAKDMTQPFAGADRLSDLLDQKKVPYEKHIYPDAGHEYDRVRGYNYSVMQDSWNRTLNFFDKYLLKKQPEARKQ